MPSLRPNAKKPLSVSISSWFSFLFTLSERLDSSTLHANHQGYVFNLTALPSSEHVLAADLRILRQATGREAAIQKYGTDYRVSIYGKPENYSASFSLYESPIWKLLNSFSFDIRHREDKWNVLSVKRAVELWQQKTQTVQLLLRVESLKSGELVPPEDVGFSREGRPRDKQALLVVFLAHENTKTSKENKRTSNATLQKSADLRKEERTKNSSDSSPRVRRGASGQGDKTASRKARQGSRPKRRRRRELCRRKPLYVDFKQLGWSNWVIAPDGYNAYFCEGLCEFPIQEHYKPTNHAVVQTIMNSVNPVLAPKACCIPNKLNAISILYVDSNDNLIYKKYEEMVVERCGCN